MASQTKTLAGTLTGWTNSENAAASDNVFATSSIEFGEGPLLQATNFGFTIPSGATITGIVVEWEKKKAGGGAMSDGQSRIIKGGSTGTENKAQGDWTTSDNTYYTYGSASDVWGETWTADDINASDFGAAISGTESLGNIHELSIDHVRITVHYTAPILSTHLTTLIDL